MNLSVLEQEATGCRGAVLLWDIEGQGTDDIPGLVNHVIIYPAPVVAALRPTLPGVALGAGVEAAQAVLVQAVTQVYAIAEQLATLVIFPLGSADREEKICMMWCARSQKRLGRCHSVDTMPQS